MAYAILRIKKMKAGGGLRAMADHHDRSRPTPNADPSRGIQVLEGAGDIVDLVNRRIARAGCPVRSNAVVAVEHLLTASPEFFRPDCPDRAGYHDRERTAQFTTEAMRWLRQTYGDRLVSARLHLDEATPHIQAVVVPLDANGRLNAREIYGGRAKLAAMQTSFAKALQPLGLERGLEGSQATHTRVSQFYGAAQAAARTNLSLPAPVEPLTPAAVPIPTPPLFGREKWAAEQTAAVDQALHQGARNARQAVQDERRAIVTHLGPQVQQMASQAAAKGISDKKRKETERTLGRMTEGYRTAVAERDDAKEKARELQARLRGQPLEQVLPALGFQCDKDHPQPGKRDPLRWRNGDCVLSIEPGDPPRFTIWEGAPAGAPTRGKNAIDLVMATRGDSFNQAVDWLAHHFGENAAAATLAAAAQERVRQIRQEVQRQPKDLEMPVPEPRHWPRVERYLTQVRGLKEETVRWLHEKGRLYADRFANAVFVRGDPANPTGAEIRGTGQTPFKGIAKGTQKAQEPFRIGFDIADRSKADLVLVESAIDAVSYVHTMREAHPNGADVVSMAGTSSGDLSSNTARHPVILAAVQAGRRIVVAYDADVTGRTKAAKVLEARPEALRVEPPAGKDWNEALRIMKGVEERTARLEAGDRSAYDSAPHQARHDAEALEARNHAFDVLEGQPSAHRSRLEIEADRLAEQRRQDLEQQRRGPTLTR